MTINVPNPGLAIAGGIRLSDRIYAIGSIADANGDPSNPNFDVFRKGETFKSIELGYSSSPDRIYFDNIHITLWHSDAAKDGSRPEDYGAAFSAAWLFGIFSRDSPISSATSLIKNSAIGPTARERTVFNTSRNLLFR